MPTIFRKQGFRFYFYSHEPNEPAHVHIDKDDSTAKFWLQPVGLARNIGFNPRELRMAQGMVSDNRETLLEAWHGYFGTKR